MAFVLRQVMLFSWVLLQVEQMLSAISRTPDVFEAAISQCMKCLLLGVARRMLEVKPFANQVFLSALTHKSVSFTAT